LAAVATLLTRLLATLLLAGLAWGALLLLARFLATLLRVLRIVLLLLRVALRILLFICHLDVLR